MLSNLDDYPIHQIAEPVRYAATSDRNFYDRYYFNGFDKTGTTMFVAGLGVYPNLGVIDAYLLVFHEGHHRVVRASGALDDADRMNPGVGPLHIDVVEPLQTLRLRCDDNEWGISIDATWTGAMPAFEEPRHYIRENGRVIFDTCRLAQTGGWSGTLTAGGKTFQLSPDEWWGTRDRSWGVRPVGESEPAGIRASNPFSWFWIYTPIRFDDHSMMIIMQENPDGSRVMEEATRIFPDGRIEHLGRPEHDLAYRKGTRFSTGAEVRVVADDGFVYDMKIEPLLPVYIGVGTGYGYDADWRHGMWQGPLVVQNFELDTNKPEDAMRLFGIVDNSARFTYTDRDGRTHVGYGLYENMAIGPHHKYGFTDMLDGYEGE